MNIFLKYKLRILFNRNLSYTIINSLGLAIGIVALILAYLFTVDELGYDRFHPNFDDVYRIVVNWNGDGVSRNWARSSPPIAEMVTNSIPDINPVVRIRKNPGMDLFTIGEKVFYEPHFFIADKDFFHLFGFRLKTGSPENVLQDKYSIVLTESAALRLFNDPNPIGRILRYDNKYDLKVTGIAYDSPKNTHLYFELIAPFHLLEEMFSERRLTHWGQFDHYTYCRLTPSASQAEIEDQLNKLLRTHAPQWVPEKMELALQPISDIHLDSNRHSELVPNSDKMYSYAVLGAALLVVMMALFNYINLTLSTFMRRHREISMRLTLGSSKLKLGIDLISEAFIVAFFSLLMAMLAIGILSPKLNEITGRQLLTNLSWVDAVLIVVSTLMIAIVAGSVPSIHMIRNHHKLHQHQSSTSRKHIRNGIFMGQLSISALIILAMMTTSRQLNFLFNESLGFDVENVMLIPIKDRSNNNDYQTIANALNALPGVHRVAFSSSTPGSNNSLTYTYTFRESTKGETPMTVVIADEEYLPLYQIQLIAGRLPDDNTAKEIKDVIINEAAVTMLELDEPIGASITGKVEGSVVGVVRDFQLNSLHNVPEPMILYNFLPTLRYVSVKTNSISSDVIQQIAAIWDQFYPLYPLEYSFLRDENQKLYSFEKGTLNALKILQPIIILIVVIGMLAYTFLMAEERSKELAIRQALGGRKVHIILQFISGLWKICGISLILISLLGYLFVSRWLQNFAYHFQLSADLFLIPIIGIVLLNILLIGGIIYKQLQHSPIKYLRKINY